ncbi:hypothetical protein N7495_008118 [Penicillium taxi]|uniref:uncharacterized protein n=1 Tax=Penicillium taxi TaxID=168475 RepID=UPI0025452601|nr:uncharacterized protein N7495_008118 [Penicillium taxi]KAJ5888077.1 hypothetical protein N7495_008118 [Penicillium taxi]
MHRSFQSLSSESPDDASNHDTSLQSTGGRNRKTYCGRRPIPIPEISLAIFFAEVRIDIVNLSSSGANTLSQI